jgi:hypothetical protein
MIYNHVSIVEVDVGTDVCAQSDISNVERGEHQFPSVAAQALGTLGELQLQKYDLSSPQYPVESLR